MVATLTSAAARRAFHCRGACLRSHQYYSGASSIITNFYSSRTLVMTNMHRNSTFHRPFFSSQPIEPPVDKTHPPDETPINLRISNEFTPSTSKKNMHPVTSTLTEDEYDPEEVISQIFMAAKWNQGQTLSGKSNGGGTSKKWNYELVRATIDKYELHLRFVLDRLKSKGGNHQPSSSSSIRGEMRCHSQAPITKNPCECHPLADQIENGYSSPIETYTRN